MGMGHTEHQPLRTQKRVTITRTYPAWEVLRALGILGETLTEISTKLEHVGGDHPAASPEPCVQIVTSTIMNSEPGGDRPHLKE